MPLSKPETARCLSASSIPVDRGIAALCLVVELGPVVELARSILRLSLSDILGMPEPTFSGCLNRHSLEDIPQKGDRPARVNGNVRFDAGDLQPSNAEKHARTFSRRHRGGALWRRERGSAAGQDHDPLFGPAGSKPRPSSGSEGVRRKRQRRASQQADDGAAHAGGKRSGQDRAQSEGDDLGAALGDHRPHAADHDAEAAKIGKAA